MRRVGLRYLPLEEPFQPSPAAPLTLSSPRARYDRKRLGLALAASVLVTTLTFGSGFVIASWNDSVAFSNDTQNGSVDLAVPNESFSQTFNNVLPSQSTALYVEVNNSGTLSYDTGGAGLQVVVATSTAGNLTNFKTGVWVNVASCSGTYTHPGVCSGTWVDVTGLAPVDNRDLAYLETRRSLGAPISPGSSKGFRIDIGTRDTIAQSGVEGNNFTVDWSVAADQRVAESTK